MRASAWSVFLRAANSQCSLQPCHYTASRRLTSHNSFHTSTGRRREGDNEPVPSQVYGTAQTGDEKLPEVKEIADEGPEEPPPPRDKSNYGSAARRAGRNVKKVKELPPVHIPRWFLAKNVALYKNLRKPGGFVEAEWDHEDQPNDEESPTDKNDQQLERDLISGDQDAQEKASVPAAKSSSDSTQLVGHTLREVAAIVRASLQVPLSESQEFATTQKPHLLLFCPKNGATSLLESIAGTMAIDNGTDLLRLSPQDIAEIGGNYLDEPSEYRSNTLSSLGYDAPLLSNARHAPQQEDPPEEEDYDEADDMESTDHGSPKPAPLQRAGFGAFHGGTIHIGAFAGSVQDIFKSLMPGGGSSQNPKPVIMKPIQQQSKDITPELQMGLLVETLLNTPEMKRAALAEEEGNAPTTTEVINDNSDQSDLTKRKRPDEVDATNQRGNHRLIVSIVDYPQISATASGGKFLDKLHEAVDARRKEGQSILIIGNASSQEIMPSLSKSGVKEVQDRPTNGAIRTVVTPVAETFSGALEEEYKTKVKNINLRHLKDMLRRLAANFEQVEEVVTQDDLDVDSKTGFLSGMKESVWSMDQVNRFATTALGLLKDSEIMGIRHIAKALMLVEYSDKGKFDWVKAEKQRQAGPSSTDSEKDKDSKERIRDLRKTCNSHEKKLLNGVVHAEDIRTVFTDVQAPPATIDALKTLTSLSLVRPDAFKYGVLATDKIPGLLLYGPPGTGKTLLARAVAKESGATVLEVSGSDVYDMYVGEAEKNVRAIFSLAKKLSPCIVFIDEADAILGARSGGSNRTSHRELINQFLREWDGMTEMSAFITVATNRPFDLDEACLRRLPRRLLVDLPTENDREAILRIHLKDEVLDPEVSLSNLASQTPYYSGSDLKNVAVAAALTCVREEFEDAANHAKDTSNTEKHQYPEKRILRPRHFAKAMEEISASISEDMGSLSAIRKFDEKYGDRRGRRKKGGYGFKTVTESEKLGSDAARVRNQT